MGETGFSVPSFIGNRHRDLTEIKTLAKELRESHKKIRNRKTEFSGKRPEIAKGRSLKREAFVRKASFFIFLALFSFFKKDAIIPFGGDAGTPGKAG
jgi:hypothetical protein